MKNKISENAQKKFNRSGKISMSLMNLKYAGCSNNVKFVANYPRRKLSKSFKSEPTKVQQCLAHEKSVAEGKMHRIRQLLLLLKKYGKSGL